MTSFEYQNILRKKRIKKVVAKEIKACKNKEKENIRTKQATKLGPPIDWATWKIAKKHVRA